MRWEEMLLDLFEDLEQQAEGLALAERDAEVAELSRAEYAGVGFADRLHASRGHDVTMSVFGVGSVSGTLVRLGADWCLVESQAQEWIVRAAAVGHARGLSGRAVDDADRPLTGRLGLGSALRGVASNRAAVVLHLTDGGTLRGYLRRVGADFAEVWVTEHGEAWQIGAEGHLELVPFVAMAAVRRS